MLDTRERTATQPSRDIHPARAMMGRIVIVAAVMLTLVALAGAVLSVASEEYETDIYVSLTSIPALLAIAAWALAIVLVPMSGRAVVALTLLLTLLSAVAIFGAFGAEEGSPGWYQALTILSIPVWIGALLFSRRGTPLRR